MRIYNKNNRNKDFKLNYGYINNLKKINIVFFFLATVTILFTPLGLLRSNSKILKVGAKSFYRSLEVIDKKYSKLTKEIFLTGDNLFSISYRYLKSFFKKKDVLNINLSFKNYQKIASLRDKAIKVYNLYIGIND